MQDRGPVEEVQVADRWANARRWLIGLLITFIVMVVTLDVVFINQFLST